MRALHRLLNGGFHHFKYAFSKNLHNIVYTRKAKLIDGKKIAQDIQDELRLEISTWMKLGNRAPCLKAIIVGEDAASKTYVSKKMLAAKDVGIASETMTLPANISETELIAYINQLNKDPGVDGILIQLPLPGHVCERTICNAVDSTKDVDGFHVKSIGKLCLNMDTFVSCTALGVIELLKRSNIEAFGKTTVICGRSKNVGLPICMILHSDHRNELPGMEATVILCHRNTPPEKLAIFAKQADIIISATGVVGLIKPEMVKKGACVIDVGITRIQTAEGKTKLVGDVDFNGVSNIAGHITPVPGGVGPMTVAMLMKNTFKAARNHANNNNKS